MKNYLLQTHASSWYLKKIILIMVLHLAIFTNAYSCLVRKRAGKQDQQHIEKEIHDSNRVKSH